MASLSDTTFHTALLLYLGAMVAYFFRLAFTRVSVGGVLSSTAAGTRIGLAGTALAVTGAAVHTVSVVTRGLAAEHVPWGNMYEYSSVMALCAVVVGLVVLQYRLGYGHLMGFVLFVAVATMAVGLLLYTPPGALVPALDSYWLKIHTSAAMFTSSVFIVGFVVTALYLVKDTAERRVAERSGAGYSGSTVGAASIKPPEVDGRPEGWVFEQDQGASGTAGGSAEVASPLAQRDQLSPLLFPVVPFVAIAVFTFAVWREPMAAIIAASAAALIGTAAWYAVPYLPEAVSLDTLAYRIIAFGFPVWTFAVMAGAIWAEESWGRYWGWDPKETASFITWVCYACYLHARSTHGWRGRRAGWIGVLSFAALMFTYYFVNLFIVGLHSYAGV